MYLINLQKFSCENSTSNYFKMDSSFCPQNLVLETSTRSSTNSVIKQENGRDYKSIHDKTKPTTASLISNQHQQLNNKTGNLEGTK